MLCKFSFGNCHPVKIVKYDESMYVCIWGNFLTCKSELKGTVSVISSKPLGKEDNTRFTTVPLT